MVQVLPGNKKSSFSEGLLSGFAESIPNAINQLIERRDQQEQMRQQQASMAQENEALAKLGINVGGVQDPKLRAAFVQQQLKDQGQQAKLQQYLSLLGGGQGGMQQQEPSQAQQFLGNEPQAAPNNDPAQNMNEAPQEGDFNHYKGMSPQQKSLLSYLYPQQAAQFQRMEDAEAKRAILEKGQEQTKDLAERKFALEKEKHEFTTTADAREYEKGLIEAWKGAKEQEKIFDALEHGADERSVGTQLRKFAAETTGLPESLFLTPTEEVQEKFANQLLQGISRIYKGKILDSEVKNYVKSNPSLMNTKEGQKRLARLGKLNAGLIIKEREIAQELIKTKGEGKPYPRLESDVADEMDKLYDDVHTQALDIMAGRSPVDRAKPGQKGTREIADKLAAKYNGDPVLIHKEMKRLGYEP